jgi:hypothetical protein
VQENRDANAGDASALVPVKLEAGGGGGGGGGGAPSCLDALWVLVQDADRLRREQPYALAKTLQVVAALWQSGGASYRALAALQRKPGLWEALVAVVQAGAGAGALAPGEEEGGPQWWASQEAACWTLQAEAWALQVLGAECFMWAGAAGAGGRGAAPGAGLPPAVAALLGGGGAGGADHLLRRYCRPLPSARLLAELQRHAAAAGAQLLGAALADEELWPSMAAGASAVAALAAAARPLTARHVGGADAARALGALSERLAAEAGPWAAPGVAALAGVLLAQAEAPARVSGDREAGPTFVYDAPTFNRRVGTVFVRHVPAVGALGAWLGAASLAASLEDARAAGAAALKTLHSAARALGAPPASGVVRGCVDALGEAVDGVVVEAQVAAAAEASGEAAAAGALAVGVHSVHVVGAGEAASVVLVLLQRWRGASADAGADAAAAAEALPLCARLLELAASWLGAAPTVAGPADAVRSTSGCLLSAALLAVSSTPRQVSPPQLMILSAGCAAPRGTQPPLIVHHARP